MPGEATRRYSGPRNSVRAEEVNLLGLLRQTHIFASTVREVLEVKLLREVSDARASGTSGRAPTVGEPGPDPEHQESRNMKKNGALATAAITTLVGIGLATSLGNVAPFVSQGVNHRAPASCAAFRHWIA